MGDAITVDWRSFLLRPEGPKTPDQEAFVEYTKSWSRPARMEPATEFRVWATDNPQPTSSVPPHVAAKAVAAVAPDSYRSFHRGLMSAYFTHNQTISDWDVLQDIAERAGVDRDELLATVQANEQDIIQLVIDEHNEAINHGITAVPTTVIAGVLPVPGAQDVDTLEMWVNRLIERRQIETAE
jgi:predicted DsbA family dithiol-disulfide isomerase